MNSDPPLLSGTVPGILDPSQSSRLLRTPGSSLFFVAFDPLTARANDLPNLSSLNIDPSKAHKRVNHEAITSSNGKRIVVETDPESGTCSWRFVPRAKTEKELFGDEGLFPRLVELCGRVVRMTQDQWDLYKLDPHYDCVVRAHPNLTTITRVTSEKHCNDSDDTFTSEFSSVRKEKSAPPEYHTFAKQASSTTCSNPECLRNKRFKSSMGVKRTYSSQTDSMSVDEGPSYVPDQTDQAKDEDVVNSRKRRWAEDRLGGTNVPEAEKLNRTVPEHRAFTDTSYLHSGNSGTNDISNSEIPAKKVRTLSPDTVRRELDKRRTRREKKRRAQAEARLRSRREILHQAFWGGLGIPPGLHNPGVYKDLHESDEFEESGSSAAESANGFNSHSDSTTDHEDEVRRLAKIEESRRKLAELEKDKPLWEESARRRQAREKEEEQARQRAKWMKEEEERQQQQAQAARRRHEEKRQMERLERERAAGMKERQWRMFVPRRPHVSWSFRQALDRYLETAASFDAMKFSAGEVSITFATIPWPVLHASFSVQDIDWDAVERFFGNVQRSLSTVEYKDLVEKSHRRFHPDRWRSRGLLSSVKDEMERDLLEVAGSTVAQAITPLWKKITGR